MKVESSFKTGKGLGKRERECAIYIRPNIIDNFYLDHKTFMPATNA